MTGVQTCALPISLNGAAASRYGYPFPHDAGMAILGKSIDPFIDMAFKLGKPSTEDTK